MTRADARQKTSRALYECFHCGKFAVAWDGDFDQEDYEGNPAVCHELHCTNCGAEIVYVIPEDAARTEIRDRIRKTEEEMRTAGTIHRKDLERHLKRLRRELKQYDNQRRGGA